MVPYMVPKINAHVKGIKDLFRVAHPYEKLFKFLEKALIGKKGANQGHDDRAYDKKGFVPHHFFCHS